MRIQTNQLQQLASELKVGQHVLLSGTVYTARDAAHKKIMQYIQQGKQLPFNLKGAVIYYAGPTQTPPGRPIGSCGPTTSGRMDVYSEMMLENGCIAMIGKGERNKAACTLLQKHKALYFCALGGAGALAAKCITSCEVVAFEELGCESVKRLQFKDFPLIVGVDTYGGNIFARSCN